jgi:hypothetical protein
MQAEDPGAEETKKESGKTVNELTKMQDYNIRPFKEGKKYE